MLPKYVLFFLLNSRICWSFLTLPLNEQFRAPPIAPLEDCGKPLILTPFIKCKEISKARKLSTVEPLLNGSNIVGNSGYFTVDEEYNSNLFFWFIRKTSSDWRTAPLVLYLQGGPGISSIIGLFEENGPYIVTKTRLERRSQSWTNDYNVLYIDQPVGTGYSFTNSSDGYVRTEKVVADQLYEALTQFFQLYPELRRNSFYVSGESYAGKYVPAISYKIHSLKKANKSRINLKGLFMISAFTNGLQNGLVNFCIQVGIIDSSMRYELERLEEMTKSFILSSLWNRAHNSILSLREEIVSRSEVTINDYTKFDSNSFESIAFLNSNDIRKKIRVGNTEYFPYSEKVHKALREDIPQSVVPWIEELLEYYPVAFVGGQFDVNVAYPVVLNTLKNLNWSGAHNYSKARRTIFRSGGRNAGYYKSAGNLIDVLIHGAGHSVPMDQPRAVLDLLNMFVNDQLSDYR